MLVVHTIIITKKHRVDTGKDLAHCTLIVYCVLRFQFGLSISYNLFSSNKDLNSRLYIHKATRRGTRPNKHGKNSKQESRDTPTVSL